MIYTSCTICGCMPKPDEWSGQVQGVCFDCGQHLVLSDFIYLWSYSTVSLHLAKRRLDQETIYCIPCRDALEP